MFLSHVTFDGETTDRARIALLQHMCAKRCLQMLMDFSVLKWVPILAYEPIRKPDLLSNICTEFHVQPVNCHLA